MKKVLVGLVFSLFLIGSLSPMKSEAATVSLEAVVFKSEESYLALSRINFYMAMATKNIENPNYEYVKFSNQKYYAKMNYYMSMGTSLENGKVNIDKAFSKLTAGKNVELANVVDAKVEAGKVIARETAFRVVNIQ